MNVPALNPGHPEFANLEAHFYELGMVAGAAGEPPKPPAHKPYAEAWNEGYAEGKALNAKENA